jgi:hypothetical protein
MKKVTTLVIAVFLSLTVLSPSTAVPTKKFANCTALNKVYPHGVAKKGYQKSGSGLTGTPKVSNKIYNQNSGSDRDKDGIACEK